MKAATLALLRATALLLGGVLSMPMSSRAADVDDDGLSPTNRAENHFHQRDGAGLYRAICQGCHMADGRGARGAGAYPALTGNARIAFAPYVITTVIHGRNGMPPFGAMLDDEQIAAVARYVRTNLGNSHREPVTAADVKALR